MVRLRELRKNKKLSMKKFGQIFNLSESTISLYENGKHDPDLETIIQFANFFGVSIDYLVGRTENPKMASDAIVQTQEGNVTTLEDSGLAKADLERITNVIEDIKKKYAQGEPSVLAAHSDGHTQEEIDADLKSIEKFLQKKKDK